MNASKLVYIAVFLLLAAKFGKYVFYHAVFTLFKTWQSCPDLVYSSVAYMIKPVSVILRLSATELSVAKTFVSAHRGDFIAVKKFSGFRRIATRQYEKLLKKRGRHEA